MLPMPPENERPSSNRCSSVALYAPSLRGGGAERVLVNLAQGLVERGIRVDVVLGTADGPYLQELPAEVSITDLHSARAMFSIPALVQYLRERRPECLISFLDHANAAAVCANLIAGSPTRVIATVHNTWSRVLQSANWKCKVLAKLMRFAYQRSASVVAVSQGSAEDLATQFQLDPGQVQVIYNPVVTPGMLAKAELRADHPWCDSGTQDLIVAIGRLTRQKDFPTLLRALAAVHKRGLRKPKLLILGEGEDRRALEQLVQELELQKFVAMPGFAANPYAILRRASMFVLSSAWEGLPTVLIEALALGVPVVATDCPSGPREILQDGRHGKLVPIGDATRLACAIEEQLTEVLRPGSEGWKPYTLSAAVQSYLSLATACKYPEVYSGV